jgi:two-component system, NarL family, response regulator
MKTAERAAGSPLPPVIDHDASVRPFPGSRRVLHRKSSDADGLTKTSPASPAKPIRLLIAEADPVFRKGLAAVLSSQPDMTVVGEATDGEQTCRLYQELAPDVLTLSLLLPTQGGLRVLTELTARGGPKARVIVVTVRDAEEDVRRALKAGARGYLVKGAKPEQIGEAVRLVAAGEVALPPHIASKLAESLAHPELSARELEVLAHLAQGRTDKEIGRLLSLSEHTVKGRVRQILTNLAATRRTEAAAIATKRGLLPAP